MASVTSHPPGSPSPAGSSECSSSSLSFSPTEQPSPAALTPLMKQYWDLKSQVPGAFLFFRMGDFYELFGEDAITAARLLEITLTSRDKNKSQPTPMAGVPHHSAQGYIQRLLKMGKKVAIAEQIEDLSSVPGAVKISGRKIVRILTPAVQFDADGVESQYLAIFLPTQKRNPGASSQVETGVLACLDASTGEVLVSQECEMTALVMHMRQLPIRHFLKIEFPNSVQLPVEVWPEGTLVEALPADFLTQKQALELLQSHYLTDQMTAWISSEAGIWAVGILVSYVLKTQQQDRMAHLRRPEPLQKPKALILGPSTAEHLDLPELFTFLNQTHCTLGARELRRWLFAPLCLASEIELRQQAIRELAVAGKSQVRPLGEALKPVYDLERIAGRLTTRLANPRDTWALGQSLAVLTKLARECLRFQAPLISELQKDFHQLAEILTPLSEKILKEQKEDPPWVARDGGIFQWGTTPELDRLLALSQNGQQFLVELEVRERDATGISSLKIRYNRVFGYYIEVTQAHLKNVPPHYQRKQTTVGAERFFTEELKKFEEEILTASWKQKHLEQELFEQLLNTIQGVIPQIMLAAQKLGQLDALLSLAQVAERPGWCFPELDHSFDLEILGGRHPLVDQAQPGSFVPNDLFLSPQGSMTLMITGPNMGGKSTLMRQTALSVLLGQMGGAVPAQKARWGVVSSIFTRIGAQDAIARGQSTFMVEMSELAHILHFSDERSLIILDEIGRGTSTYDGMSVAWATLEWIATEVRSRTLFATHYHELVHLDTQLPAVGNAHMAVEERVEGNQKSLRFLYELRKGPTAESFGIHVAQLAGLPRPLIDRAWRILGDLESHQEGVGSEMAFSGIALEDQSQLQPENEVKPAKSKNQGQLSLFQSPPLSSAASPFEIREPVVQKPHPVLEELKKVDLNTLTPLAALNLLFHLRNSVDQTH